ncbi:hypothetical protein [Roseixanthobacter pseudopolyaromaticivorans]|uniref:hypothetical protein n=1 Tax=Xanthobacteraceae TaxID=335928 RepID=UPI0037281DEE
MKDITGRDGFIEGQAFVYAIACIQGLPPKKQERSNMADMARIVRATTSPEELALLVYGVEIHTGRRLDLHVAETTKADIEFDLRFDRELISLHQQRDAHLCDQAGYVSLAPDFGPSTVSN